MSVRRARSGGHDLVAASFAALAFTLLAQVVRVYPPLGFDLAEDLGGTGGYVAGVVVALLVFGAPILAAVPGIVGRGRARFVAATGALVLARSAIQSVHPVPLWLGALGVGVALVAVVGLVASIRRVFGDRALLLGVLMGLALDTAIRGAFQTWDVAWRDDPAAVAAFAVLGVATLGSAFAVRVSGEAQPHPPALRLAVFGPFLALQLLFLQNPAAVGAHAELPLEAAVAVVLAGDVAAALGLSVPLAAGGAGVLAIAASAGAYALTEVTGPAAAALVVGEQVLLVRLLARALVPEPLRVGEGRPLRLAGSVALGSLLFVLPVLLYQVHHEVPLPFPNAVVPAAAAALVGLGATVRRGRVTGRIPRTVGLVPLALLAVPAAVWLSAPEPELVEGDGCNLRIVSFNVHGAVNVRGQVHPEGTARIIEAQEPDVLVLQEVSRGWPIFGTVDVAEWLSRRLRMPYVYEPAAEEGFGNAILSRLPIVETRGGPLPFGEGPQRRSYLLATIDVGGGRTLTVVGTHLQGSTGSDTRARQIDRVLEVLGGASPAVVAGDMNLQPNEDDVQRFLGAGLVSAQDAVGDPCEPTAWDPEPEEPCDRPDWIFATPDLALSDLTIVRAPASDHLALAVTLTLG